MLDMKRFVRRALRLDPFFLLAFAYVLVALLAMNLVALTLLRGKHLNLLGRSQPCRQRNL